jgi:hypothetical protein
MAETAQSDDSIRHLRCPECGLSVAVPADEALPDEGPTCAMGHAPTVMQQAITGGPGYG